MSDHPPRGRETLALWKEYRGAMFRKLRIWKLCDALELGNETLKAELAEANAVLQNPAKWHKWCDIRVLEQIEAVKAELARKDELIDDLRAMHGVPSDADLARARDDEARECAAICHDYAFDQRRSPLATGGAFACKAAIERRISERAK